MVGTLGHECGVCASANSTACLRAVAFPPKRAGVPNSYLPRAGNAWMERAPASSHQSTSMDSSSQGTSSRDIASTVGGIPGAGVKEGAGPGGLSLRSDGPLPRHAHCVPNAKGRMASVISALESNGSPRHLGDDGEDRHRMEELSGACDRPQVEKATRSWAT